MNSEMFDKLSNKEYQLIEYLMINKGMILSRDMIADKIWELDDLVASNEKLKMPYAEVVTNMASCEVLEHNRKELTRMIENESHKTRTLTKARSADRTL